MLDLPLSSVSALRASWPANVAAVPTAAVLRKSRRVAFGCVFCDMEFRPGWCLIRVSDAQRSACNMVQVARLVQNRSRLSAPPNRVVKIVRSASRMSPPRPPPGGIHRKELNS